MGTKLFSLELPDHKGTIDTWIATLIQGKLGVSEWIAPLGADGIIPSQFLPNISLSWGNITGILSDQTDLNTALGSSTDSPAFSGVPTAPNAVLGTDSLQIATTAFVQASIGTIPKSSVSNPPISLTTDTTFTADDVVGKYYVVNEASPIEIALPSAVGIDKMAFNFVIQNKGTATVIVRDSSGSLLESVPTNTLKVFSVQDATVQNGYKAIINIDTTASAGFITPPIDVYKSGIIEQSSGIGGKPTQLIEITSTKWAIMYSTTDSSDAYVQLFEWTGSVFNYGTAVEVTGGATYNSAWIWKQNDTLIACGLETGDGANYLRSISISGLTLTANTIVAVQTSTATYSSDTTQGYRLSDTQSILWYYNSSAGDPSVKIATVNGTSWTFGTEYAISPSGSCQSFFVVSPTEFIAIYYNSGLFWFDAQKRNNIRKYDYA